MTDENLFETRKRDSSREREREREKKTFMCTMRTPPSVSYNIIIIRIRNLTASVVASRTPISDHSVRAAVIRVLINRVRTLYTHVCVYISVFVLIFFF